MTNLKSESLDPHAVEMIPATENIDNTSPAGTHFQDAFIRRVSELRRAKHMSKAAYSKAVGERMAVIIRESPKDFPGYELTIELLIASADVMGCTVDYLLGREGEV